jgi:diacylglycerol O-acyltransferase
MSYTHYERLSAVDAAFLAVEDGKAHMHIGSVSIFEPGPLALEGGGIDIGRIRHLTEVQLHKTPRFRQKLAFTPLTAAPVWIDDPAFHLDYHVRHTALPHPGDTERLARLASRIMSQPLDRRRPLWELWVVEGLEEGRFALISKIHHAMADGISGVDLAGALIGKNPDFRPAAAPAWIPRPAPGTRDLLRGELGHQVGSVWELLRGSRDRGREEVRNPTAVSTDPSLAARLRNAAAAVAAAVETPPPTPLNLEIGPNRRFAWLRLGLDRLGEIREASGATLNDVVLAIVSGAVRGFLLRRGCAVRGLEFCAMVPVSVRTTEERGQLGNRVSQLLVHLPVETEDPLERLRIVRERTRELKQSGQAEGGQLLTGLSEVLPPNLAGVLERLAAQRSFGNMVVTNVPGAPFTAYLLGARLLESYPLVPLSARQALNVAVLSYDGFLHWGVNADYDAVPDVADFVRLLGEEAETLHKLAQARGSAEDDG